MKKKLIAVVVVLSLCLSFLVGCGLVVENQQRDFNQVVAQVGDSNIRKGELVEAVSTYAPQYIQQYGLSVEQAVNLIVEQLIKRELQIDAAMESCKISGKSVNNSFINLDADTKNSAVAKEYKKEIEQMLVCFTEEDLKKVESKTWKDISSVIEALESEVLAGDKDLVLTKEQREEQAKYIEENAFEDRKTRPSFSSKDEKIEEYPELFFKDKVYGNITSADTGKNYPEVDSNGEVVYEVQQETYDMFVKKIKSVSKTSVQEFMLKVVKSYMEQELLDKYQDKIEAEAVAKYDDEKVMMDSINEYYANMIAQQQESNKIDLNTFDKFITSEDRDTVSFYNSKGGYAEVKNLLIMFDGDTKSSIEDLKKDNYSEEELIKARDIYASQLDLKDLRKTKKLNPAFNIALKQTDKDKEDSWYVSADYVKGANDRFIPVEDMPAYIPIQEEAALSSIATVSGSDVSFDPLKKYMVGAMKALADGEENERYTKKDAKYVDQSLDKYEDAFIDLIYQYNEDTGMFDKSNPNYMVNVLGMIGEKSKYVKEFQNACEDLINTAITNQEGKENPSVSNMPLEDRIAIVTTEYGVHVIMLTNVFFKGEITNQPDVNDLTIENTLTYNIAELIKKSESSDAYINKIDSIYNEAKANNGFKIFSEVFKDVVNL